jgi:hypothetical protein
LDEEAGIKEEMPYGSIPGKLKIRKGCYLSVLAIGTGVCFWSSSDS